MSRLTQFVLDCFREQEKERQQQRLPYEHRWHRLPHPSARPGSKGQPFFLAQVCREMRSWVRARCRHTSGELVWIEGPNPAGKYTDINIFRQTLIHHLDPFERVVANDRYIGEASSRVKCPGTGADSSNDHGVGSSFGRYSNNPFGTIWGGLSGHCGCHTTWY